MKTIYDIKPYKSGLYPAVPNQENPDMENCWIRDNYWIWHATKEDNIPQAIAQIVKDHSDKIYYAINNPDNLSERQHFHPVYNKKLEQIGKDWGFIQWDSVGNAIEILAKTGYTWEATLLKNYLEAVNFLQTPDYGMWEEQRKTHPSSIAAVIRGYKALNTDQKKIQQLKTKMKQELPRKNLATATILYPEPLVNQQLQQQTKKQLQTLERKHGLIRYVGDNWNGEQRTAESEPAWTFGHAYMYLITGKEKYYRKLKQIKDRHGELPESMVNQQPNTNTPLLWSEALYQKCREKHFQQKQWVKKYG